MARYDPKYIDSEEKALVRDIKRIDPSKLRLPTKKEQALFRKSAKQYLRNEAKMNIRIDSLELNKIKNRAAQEGLKYQSLVKSVLHKYITGQLVEKKQKVG